MMTVAFERLGHGIVSAKRVNEVLDTIPEIQDSPDALAFGPTRSPGAVAFENVAFHYTAAALLRGSLMKRFWSDI